MNAHERRERVRAILTGNSYVRPGSVFDPLSARAAEALGFELMMLAGSTASLAVLGAPDIVLLTLSEFAEQVHRVTRAVSLPLMVDADHGYGNALNVMRCVQELESAGVAAMSIEDTVLPRQFGHPEEQYLSVEEGAGKMRAAVAARTDPSLVILGRTGAIRAGVDTTRARMQAFEAAGVDGIFLAGMRTRAELEAVRSASSIPIVLGGATAELDDDAYLASMGVRIGGWNHQPSAAAAAAAYDTLRRFREQSAPAKLPPEIDKAQLMDVLIRKGDYDSDAASYMR
jgi:carboxyvinyl-carboxyphosphonate phosphorylmutase